MNNKWIRGALPAVLIHLSIGSVYAWSVLEAPIKEALEGAAHLSLVTSLTFSTAIFFLGMSATFLGKFIEKIGPKKSAFLAAAFFGLGFIGSGLAILWQSAIMLLICYGVIGGIGLGIGYIAPVKPLLRWFYQSKGLASGIAVMGFGFATVLASPVMAKLIATVGVGKTFIALGTAYICMITVAALLVKDPPEGYEVESHVAATMTKPLEIIHIPQVMRSLSFYALWFIFFINIACGISMIKIASPMMMTKFSFTPEKAAIIVGIIALFNGVGRFAWATVSDWLGRPLVFSGFQFLQIFLFIAAYFITDSIIYSTLLYIIVSCYGGGFACVPAYLADLYGSHNVSILQGRILTAWAIAGYVGPLIASTIYDKFQCYDKVAIVFAVLMTISFIVSFIPMRAHIKRHGKIRA